MDDVDLYGDVKSDDVRLRYPNARAKPLNYFVSSLFFAGRRRQ